ncbi:MAG: hypothetical protein WD448_12190 [Woeseia sp.]
MPHNNVSLKALAAKLRNPAWLSFVWFGMSAGISLLETPVRFTAPTVTRAMALDIGRVVFLALNRAELVALALLVILAFLSGRARQLLAAGVALVLIMLAQTAWLLPELASRSQQIVQGIEPGPSIAHAAFSVLQLVKLALLLYIGFRCLAAPQDSRRAAL